MPRAGVSDTMKFHSLKSFFFGRTNDKAPAALWGMIWAALWLNPPALAQDQDELEQEFELIEEQLAADEEKSATKHRQEVLWSPAPVTVLTREDIRACGARTLADLLRRVPGFDVYQAKPLLPMAGTRALTDPVNTQVLLLVDGREALVEATGFPMWGALGIDLEQVQRVEVIRGPASSLYGANAFSAVVNVTTVAEKPTGGEVTLSGAEQGHRRLSGQFHWLAPVAGGKLSASVTAGSEGIQCTSDPASDSCLLTWHTYDVLRYRKGDWLNVSLHGGLVYWRGPLLMSMGDLYQDGYGHVEMGQGRIRLSQRADLQVQFYHVRFDNDFWYRTQIWAAGFRIADVMPFVIENQSIDGQVQLDYRPFDRLFLLFGGNLRHTFIDARGVEPNEIQETRGGVFLHGQWQLFDELQLFATVRGDWNSKTDAALSSRVALVYRPWSHQAFRLSFGMAYRKPTLYETNLHPIIQNLYVPLPDLREKIESGIANPDLLNEKIQSLEAGWRARLLDERLQVDLDLFYNRYTDTIFFHLDPGSDTGLFPDTSKMVLQYENRDPTIIAWGGEAAIRWNFTDEWSVWTNLGVRWVIDSVTDQYLANEPHLRFNLGGRYHPATGPLADIAAHYVSSYQTPLFNPYSIFDQDTVLLGDRWLLFARLGYRFLQGGGGAVVEAGLTARVPLPRPFREYGGAAIPREVLSDRHTLSDLGGERMVRLVELYLHASF